MRLEPYLFLGLFTLLFVVASIVTMYKSETFLGVLGVFGLTGLYFVGSILLVSYLI